MPRIFDLSKRERREFTNKAIAYLRFRYQPVGNSSAIVAPWFTSSQAWRGLRLHLEMAPTCRKWRSLCATLAKTLIKRGVIEREGLQRYRMLPAPAPAPAPEPEPVPAPAQHKKYAVKILHNTEFPLTPYLIRGVEIIMKGERRASVYYPVQLNKYNLKLKDLLDLPGLITLTIIPENPNSEE